MHTSDLRPPDFARLGDSALISRRKIIRAALERLPPYSTAHQRLTAWYDLSTLEIDARARRAWTRQLRGRR